MNLIKIFTRTVRNSALAIGAVAAGAALTAFAKTQKGLELRRAATEKLDAAIASIRARMAGEPIATPAEADPEPEVTARVEHEHALEHGAVGRSWASSHAKKPHVAASTISDATRNTVLRRVARHV